MNKKVQIKRIQAEGDDFFGLPPEKDLSQSKKVSAFYNSSRGQFDVRLTEAEWEEAKNALGGTYDFELRHDPMSGKPHPFWEAQVAKVLLEPNTFFLDLGDNPMNIIKLGVLRGHPWVANSLQEYENGLWPEARWIIIDDDQDVKAAADKAVKTAEAYKLLTDLSDDEKRMYLQIINKKVYTGVSPAKVMTDFEEVVKGSPKELIELHEQDRDRVELQAQVVAALNKGIFTRKGSMLQYGDFSLGIDIEGTVDFLISPENQQLKAQIIHKILKY